MQKFTLILSSMVLALPALAAQPQTGSGETDGYKLVWQDLFDGEELNQLRWNIEVNGAGGGNNELQYYTDRSENVRVGDDGEGNGCLILTARREEYKNRHFTSGRVNSMHLVTFTHGKIEASIKLPATANGLWPAFWMMGNDYSEVGWPKCGETDILEMGHSDGIKNGTTDRYFNGACHWGQGWPQASYAKSATKSYSLQDGEFHLFTLIWDENNYKMYVDLDKNPVQVPYYSIGITCDDPGNEWSAGNYFHKENFILFNLAVGGNFPGIHDAAGITAINEDNGQEASMYVNYVKIYQKEGAEGNTLFSAVPTDALDSESSVDELAAESEVFPQIYTVGGQLVRTLAKGMNPSEADIEKGIYIVKSGNSTYKFVKK
ncbi:MAG: family 16 glycosylhydrolase [Muribaculaceae bacterium]|nr:family 16 glycosylhydrolase [Muribaculaceae bacterium]